MMRTQKATPKGTDGLSLVDLPESMVGDIRRFLALSRPAIAGERRRPQTDELIARSDRLRSELSTALEPQARMFLSLHIPKTAGLTFSRLLAEHFREGFYRSYWDITNCHGEPALDFPANARCIHGHIDLPRLLSRYPGASLVTWVREPVQRLASFYYYWLREPDQRHPLCRVLHERKLSLLEFARMDEARNEMSRYFGHLRPMDFAFIGLFEELAASVEVFRRRFGLPAAEISHGHRNPDRSTDGYRLTAEERAEIAALNRADRELYDECVERFRRESRSVEPQSQP